MASHMKEVEDGRKVKFGEAMLFEDGTITESCSDITRQKPRDHA